MITEPRDSDLFVYAAQGELTSEGLYRYLDQAVKAPPMALALRWLNDFRLTVTESRIVNVVLSETLARKRGFAAISLHQFMAGIGLTPGPFSRMRLDPALKRLQQRGILEARPGQGNGKRGRPAKVWQLGIVTRLLEPATTPVQEVILATPQTVFLATDSVALFPKKPKRTRARRSKSKDFSLLAQRETNEVTAKQVKELWQAYQGWPAWPSNRRHDAILITQWVKSHPMYSLAFWQAAIDRTPRGACFRYLTHSADKNLAPAIDHWYARWQEEKTPPRMEQANETLVNFKRLLGLPA